VRIRLKLAILFVVLTLALLVGVGAFFLFNLRSGLQNSMNNSLRTSADEVVAQLDASSTTPSQLRLADSYGQVLTATGVVVQSTDNALNQPLITPAQAARASQGSTGLFDETYRPARRPTANSPGTVRVRVLYMPSGHGGNVIAVASSREVIDEAIERAAKELLTVGAIVLLVAGPGAWFLTRAALQPVERMRLQAAELQAREAGAGLTVPGTTDEISRLAETLNGLLSRLHEALEHERAFVADAGHELRTPLTILRGELELARRPGRSPEQLAETIEIAGEETERLVRLAEDLLVLARDGQAMAQRREPFDVRSVAESARLGVDPRASARGITVEVAGPQVLFANGDIDQIRRAVDNLISNAVRFSPDGDRVCIELKKAGPDIEIAVLDRGPGFSVDFLPHAFERFRRGDSARTRDGEEGGSGLGLAIVRSIARDHGGDADATNRVDGPGARVRLHWPAELAD
jgi:signal transduction histidine kinase